MYGHALRDLFHEAAPKDVIFQILLRHATYYNRQLSALGSAKPGE
jgi:hypothetical protein